MSILLDQKHVHKLFFGCLRVQITDEIVSGLRQLSATGWDLILRLAAHQRVAPLLYQNLQTHQLQNLIPTSTTECLKRNYQENAWRNLHLQQDLNQILRTLNESQIPVIVLKGAYLASAIVTRRYGL
ncbi:MAG TPA: nucleotidyltransferase family protein [Blastocatellia bacterium]|nr:nucleotidyltransferase family protein [Blastocatellia bacterium]